MGSGLGSVTKTDIIDLFYNVYGYKEGVSVYFAPGRVNLIGEHTDYNGGHVFPCALTIGTYAAVSLRNDDTVRLYSENVSRVGIVKTNLDECTSLRAPGWCAYPAGIMWTLESRGFKMNRGIDILYYGDIPAGAGLSSSASIEVLTAYMISDLFGFGISNVDIARIGQYSENNYNGMNCGIMDQFASAMGKKDNAIFLDTATLEYEYAPVELDDKKIVIMNTNKKHSLCDSEYNTRRRECEKAVEDIKSGINIETLGELNEEQFEEYKCLIKDSVCVRRARHAVYENRRTINAVEALKAGDMRLFGKLMKESHVSLRDDYEVSCKELDILVEETEKLDGVYGVRMTGGGFGGCCVSIIEDAHVDAVIERVGRAYKKRVGYDADFYVVSIGDGVRRL